MNDPEGVQYSINGGTFQSTPFFGALCPGDYSITMHDANGCTAASTVIVGAPTPVVAAFDFNPDTLFVSNTLASFDNLSTNNAVSFEWDFAGLGNSSEEHTIATVVRTTTAEW